MPRLAIITPVFPPYHGGIGYVAKRHAEQMAKRGYDVEVFAPAYSPSPTPPNSLQSPQPGKATVGNTAESAVQKEAEQTYITHRIRSSFHYGNSARIKIADQLQDADIVHLHYPFYFTAELLPKWRKQYPSKRFFVTYHMDPDLPGLRGLYARWYAHHHTQKILSAADTVFVSTKEYAQAHTNGEWFKANNAKVVEAPFGVDVDRFLRQPVADEFYRQHGLDPQLPTVLFVGGLDTAHAFKGVDILIQAWSKVKSPAQLIIVGDGDRRSVYERLTTSFDSRIHFVGAVDYQELPQWFWAADIFVLPSIGRGEAFGLVLLEAMAAQVFCVASDLPGVATVMDHGKSGVLVAPGSISALTNALDDLIQHPQKRQQYIQHALQKVQQDFSWDSMADTYHLWYTQAT